MAETAETGWRAIAIHIARLLRFYSRLSVPHLPFERERHALPDFDRALVWLPVAGLVIALTGCAATATGWWLGLGAPVSACLGVAALVMTTGAFHEDGLADVADGFWGGATVERRLEIMKDSRIGTFGGAALVLGLALRIAALATLLDRAGLAATLGAMLAVAAYSRSCALLPFCLLPSAREDGAGAQLGAPPLATALTALAFAALLVLVIGHAGPLGNRVVPAMLAGLALTFGMIALSRAKIGGQTGDVAGASQQLSEIAFLLALLGR